MNNILSKNETLLTIKCIGRRTSGEKESRQEIRSDHIRRINVFDIHRVSTSSKRGRQILLQELAHITIFLITTIISTLAMTKVRKDIQYLQYPECEYLQRRQSQHSVVEQEPSQYKEQYYTLDIQDHPREYQPSDQRERMECTSGIKQRSTSWEDMVAKAIHRHTV